MQDHEHDRDMVSSADEAERLTRTRNAALQGLMRADEPHGFFVLNLQPYRIGDDRRMAVASTIHGCGGCLVEAVAKTLGSRLSMQDVARLLDLLRAELRVRVKNASERN